MCKVWILDFGDFGIWDFGFWGSWILDFGLGILDGHLVTKFWMLHKKRRLCTPNRVGGLLYMKWHEINHKNICSNDPKPVLESRIHSLRTILSHVSLGKSRCAKAIWKTQPDPAVWNTGMILCYTSIASILDADFLGWGEIHTHDMEISTCWFGCAESVQTIEMSKQQIYHGTVWCCTRPIFDM